MGFFDLNIPYTESTKHNSAADKSTRLKLAVKAMELGYTGVAYNRTITRVMSELDRCSISLFPLSSFLKVSPSISSSVNLHRRLLDVPITTPFRQYTRLTVVVDMPAQGSTLNSGNPILKSYDIVAVRPLKQDSFDQACKNYEVDIIAIDFAENRFRLKQSLIKAAIERGVYFEITYSGLLVDAQLRRQMISNAKLLVDWTRGKNLIFSSAAPFVTELRGPYDVANLACLLGFSMERAKASVSKTCRSLLESSLRKKKFFKEAIRVELISSTEQTDVEGAGFDDELKWDPISSGEGDLQLDDLAKSFAASRKDSKTVKAIDFVSIIDELPSHGLHIKDIVSESKSESYDNNIDFSAATKIEKPSVVDDVSIDSKLYDPPVINQASVMGTVENCELMSANENPEALARVEGDETCAMNIEEDNLMPNDSNVPFSCPEAEQQNLQAEVHDSLAEPNVSDDKGGANTCNALSTSGMLISFDDNLCSALHCEEDDNVCSDAHICPIISSNEASIEKVLEREQMRDTRDVTLAPVDSCLALSGESLNEDVKEHLSVMGVDEMEIGANSFVIEPLEEVCMKVNMESKDDSPMNNLYAPESSSSERFRKKQWGSRRSVSIPFKRVLKHSHFKKCRKSKTKGSILSLSDLIG